MRWPWRTEQRAEPDAQGSPWGEPYTDAIVAAIQAQATGASHVNAAALASLETAAGMYARAFASAEVTPRTTATAALTPAVLALTGRELVRRGECCLYVDVARGAVTIRPAGSWDVRGGMDESRWFYRIDLFGASAHTTRLVPSESVIHPRYAVRPDRPWQGVSPLAWCPETATLAARIERHVATDVDGPVGQFGTVEGTAAQADSVEAAMRRLRGTVALASAGGPAPPGAAPAGRVLERVGADPADAIPALREQVTTAVLGACGVPPELASGGAETARREAWRQFLHGTIAPVGRIVAAELAAKLDAPDLRLTFKALMASDVQGRARAYQSLTKAGMDGAQASRLAGFDEA